MPSYADGESCVVMKKATKVRLVAILLGPALRRSEQLNFETVLVERQDDGHWRVKYYPASIPGGRVRP